MTFFDCADCLTNDILKGFKSCNKTIMIWTSTITTTKFLRELCIWWYLMNARCWLGWKGKVKGSKLFSYIIKNLVTIGNTLTLLCTGGGVFRPPYQLWSLIALSGALHCVQSSSQLGHMGNLCDPGPKKARKNLLYLSYTTCDEMTKKARTM